MNKDTIIKFLKYFLFRLAFLALLGYTLTLQHRNYELTQSINELERENHAIATLLQYCKEAYDQGQD